MQIIIAISQQCPPGHSGERPSSLPYSEEGRTDWSGPQHILNVLFTSFHGSTFLRLKPPPPLLQPNHFNECNLSVTFSMRCALIMMLMVSVGVVLHGELLYDYIFISYLANRCGYSTPPPLPYMNILSVTALNSAHKFPEFPAGSLLMV